MFRCFLLVKRSLKLIAFLSSLVLFFPDTPSAAPSLLIESGDNYVGDLDALVEKRTIRVLVNYSPTNFFIADGKPRGFEYDLMEEFRQSLQKQIPKDKWPIVFIYKPVAFGDLLPLLEAGYGDIAVGGLTITKERRESIDFTKPYLQNVAEIIVGRADFPAIDKLEDLSGKAIFINPESSFAEHLALINQDFDKRGLSPIKMIPANTKLTDEDILQMVNSGIVDFTIADLHVAQNWAEILPNLRVYEDITIRDDGKLAWAIRKDSPQLMAAINKSMKSVKKGSLLGNIYFKKYFEQTKWIENPLHSGESKKLKTKRKLFEKYGLEYGIDWLALAALGYQESRLDQSVKSDAGAIGIMQVLPTTAAGNPINITNVDDIDGNIHAGAKYLAHLRDVYFDDPDIADDDRLDFMLAAYNAGPNKVQSMREQAAKEGLNPNKWFSNVEQIARKIIGRETVDYVANITKYYSAYRLAFDYHVSDLAKD
ncbi:transporter substrate-binding domain-containing protein [Kiloniella majae]|uniref:transporter substrate-binding domain-containing protein n=1 Tax=Kiloniella majae TaxID=1938558 RepID=UPI0015C4E8F2|nr:transporter substrate-binding domain-containing protein [Kiloniella majae]